MKKNGILQRIVILLLAVFAAMLVGTDGANIDAMAKAIYDAGYRKNDKQDVTDKYVGGNEKGGVQE